MKSSKMFLLTAALFLYCIITVATCAGVWGNPDANHALHVIAGLLLATNAYVIYRKAMAMSKTIKENGGIK